MSINGTVMGLKLDPSRLAVKQDGSLFTALDIIFIQPTAAMALKLGYYGTAMPGQLDCASAVALVQNTVNKH
jgi:hypothetical protein